MQPIAQTVRDHRLVSFFALTYTLSWSLVPFGSFLPTGALVAALIVVYIADGKVGLHELGARVIKWRVGWIWYVAALGIPAVVHVVTIGLNLGLGSTVPTFSQFNSWYSVLVVFAVRMIDPLNGPVSEEPSFRGFAQPTLQRGRSIFSATAILAVLVTIWHVPLYFMSEFDLHPIESLATFGCTFVYAWLFNHSGGSVLITLIAHTTEGTIRIGPLWPTGPDADRIVLLYSIVWFTAGVAVVMFDWRFWAAAERETDLTPGATLD